MVCASREARQHLLLLAASVCLALFFSPLAFVAWLSCVIDARWRCRLRMGTGAISGAAARLAARGREKKKAGVCWWSLPLGEPMELLGAGNGPSGLGSQGQSGGKGSSSFFFFF